MKRSSIRSMSAKRRKRLEGPTAPRERDRVALRPVERPCTYSGTTTGAAPKENVLRSPAYENAVRSLGFCVRCGYVCRPQFCHRDEGKGMGIKTDVREGWAGCGPHDGVPGCHYEVGTSGVLTKQQRRDEDKRLGAITRGELKGRGLWPAGVAMWSEA